MTGQEAGRQQTGIAEISPDAVEERVFVVHSDESNAKVICRYLGNADLHCEMQSDVDALADAVREGAGAAVIGSGMLSGPCEPLRTALSVQPTWSHLPIVVLVPPEQEEVCIEDIAEKVGPRGLVRVVEQPARCFEIVSLVRAALSARRGQYKLRYHLQREAELRRALQESRHELRALNESLEERVEKRTKQVRELSRALTRAEDQERQRISQILHDDLQQRLYGIQLKLNVARLEAEAGRRHDLVTMLAEADEWILNAVQITRSLAVDLSPPILKGEGLTDALEWLITQMKELHDLEVELVAEHAFHMPDEDLRVLLFQLVRELLFNVVKHAGAPEACIELSDVDHHIQIDVTDQGRGFNMEEVLARSSKKKGLGLFSVRERLNLFGGSMSIDTEPERGTRVRLEVPVELG